MKTIIFILGTGHCGSTLLDLLLGSHSQAFSLGEVNRVLSLENEQKACDLCGFSCQVWNRDLIFKLKKTRDLNFIEKVLSKIHINYSPEVKFYDKLFKATKKNVLIDSSKTPNWISKNGDKLLKGRKYKVLLIYLSRDGRAVINSLYRKNPTLGVPHFAKKWVSKMIRVNNCYEEWPESKKIQVKYKDLAEYPTEIVKNILSKINLQYEEHMMRFWEHEHHTVSGNAGTKSLVLKFQNNNRFKEIDWNLNRKEYYKGHELGIVYDERWRQELEAYQLDEINSFISDLNKEII